MANVDPPEEWGESDVTIWVICWMRERETNFPVMFTFTINSCHFFHVLSNFWLTDADNGPSPIPVIPRLKKDDRWEGEDEDDDVKDNWDDEDEVAAPEPQPAKQPSQSSKPSSKKALQKKIAEREAAERRQTPLTPDEQLKEKLARQKLQEESDLKVALESFGVNDYSLECKEDMDKFRTTLVEKMKSIERNPLYVGFLEATFRDLCASLETDDIKRIASSLTLLSNEKLKASKGTKKKKKATASLKMDKSDFAVYDDVDHDYDDFMWVDIGLQINRLCI